ncbi:dihydrodipicolinate synthase family protein [Cellulosimicrobium arenosum]|uniref:Dihydrodipicolinate synthase family protein n=1 Tax=Cellulosimicrobium arenosum TaxID=2708133 RepID=A0A927IZN6_9MICO|nr:dihydrodipicolinate synthase family protein [Cellulosimicrobium arenosum]MBD8078607.1 dihydrodipicolinate synthase family protein [Cellulosimicrobium arenosum]
MTARIVSAVPVPFTTDGTLDPETFEKSLVAISAHVGGALVAGTTGEFPALDDAERVELFRRAARVLGTDRVIAHLGHGSAHQVLRLAAATAELGISRFALLTPYYLPTDDDGVVDFFRALTEAHPQADVYAYLFPERTGSEVSPAVLARVLALPGMVGVKLSGGAAARLSEYAAVLQPGQELYSGDDATLPAVLAAGGTGVVSGVSSAFPQTFAALARALDAEDPAADSLQRTVQEIVPLVGPTVPRLKAAMAARDGAPWASRMSLPAVDAATRTRITEVVAAHR